MESSILVGIDGGGTYTRVAVATPQGELLAYVSAAGGAAPSKNALAAQSVQETIAEALLRAGCTPGDVSALAAGIATYNSEADIPWVDELTRVPGLDCPRHHFNDAHIAQVGAFLSEPGIIAICGTGSNIFAITGDGRHMDNYPLGHYATVARFLAIEAVHAVITEAEDARDRAFGAQTRAWFGVQDRPALAQRGLQRYTDDPLARKKLFGDFAPSVTAAAAAASPIAMRVCDRAINALVTGIRLLGACFDVEPIPVALVGGVARSAYIRDGIARALSLTIRERYALAEPALPAVLGAVLLAMQAQGITPDAGMLPNLHAGAEAIRRQETA